MATSSITFCGQHLITGHAVSLRRPCSSRDQPERLKAQQYHCRRQADWANKCNSSKFRQHPDFKCRRRRKIKAVEDARKLDRIDWLEGLGKEATAADEAGDIKELHRIRRILHGKSTAFSNTKPQNITENGITRPFTDDAERIEHCACFCESKFAEPPDSNPLPDIGSASSRLDDPDTAVTRELLRLRLLGPSGVQHTI